MVKRALGLGLTVSALVAPLVGASPALAGIPHDFAVFSDCPVKVSGVAYCVVSNTTSGEFHLGKKTVPVNKTVTLQGGVTEKSELIAALDGNTLSKTPLVLPGGLIGVELLPPLTEVTATAELAGQAFVHPGNLKQGTAVEMPLKVKLDNPALGSACYLGSSSEPITLVLTAGTTNPPPPNKPITGNPGTLEAPDGGKFFHVTGSSLVDNAFAAPGANGCGGLLSLIVDPSVDFVAGLPAAAGNNTAILSGELFLASAVTVKAQQEVPAVGRCEKVVGVKGVFHGHWSDKNCTVLEADGRYEWASGPGAKPKFTAKSAAVTLESTGKSQIKCTGSTGAGEYTGAKTATAVVTLTGCKSTASKATCQSSGAGTGEIVTSQLQGQLGFIKDVFEGGKTVDVVGLDLKHEPTLLTAECGAGTKLSVTGSVIAPISSDKMSTTGALTYTAEGGKQLPEAFEEGPKDTLSMTLGGGGAEQAGLSAKVKLTNEEKLEVKGLVE
jgi:hypothetical protein